MTNKIDSVEFKKDAARFFAALDKLAKEYLKKMADISAPDFELSAKSAEKLNDAAWCLAQGSYRPSAFVIRVLNSYAATNDPASLMELIEERASEIEDGGRGFKQLGGGWIFQLKNEDDDPVYWYGHNVVNNRGRVVGWTFNADPHSEDLTI